MNIFVLDKNPTVSATYHCDKHVVKMIVESAQLLCSAFYFNSDIVPPYKLTHANHPCAKWVREAKGNFDWTLQLFESLLKEYTLRYNKTHKCSTVLNWIKEHYMELRFTNKDLMPFVLAMPDKYKSDSVVKSYRDYYMRDKVGFAKWNYTNKPFWYKSLDKSK